MTYDTLIFDLDGTISDPKDGIIRSINYALKSHGMDPYPETDLLFCIGPPLDQSLKTLTGISDLSEISVLVAKFRERYAELGYAENQLYGGIKPLLSRLKGRTGVNIGLCTAKRVDFAHQILEMFKISEFFDFVDGGDIGLDKATQLRRLLKNGTITPQSVMIGDRYVDIEAAHENSLDAAGVLWGYGSYDELSKYNPKYLFKTPDQLKTLAQAS